MRPPYPAKTMQRARELNEAGWKPTAIRRLLGEEGHEQPSVYTIGLWVNDKYRQRQLAKNRAGSARRSIAKSSFRWPSNRSPEWKLHRMRVLHNAGLSCSAIATVMTLDFPESPLTERQVEGAVKHDRMPRTLRVLA